MSNRKIYSIDSGLLQAIAFRFSEEEGRILENTVFLELKRKNKEVYYHENGNECDFVIKEGTKIIKVIQVSKDLSDVKTKDREINNLTTAMDHFSLKEGLLVTKNEDKTIKIGNKTIKIIPLWKFLLES